MNLENSSDLLLFINKEKLHFNNINNYRIYSYFCKCFLKTIIEIDDKFKSLNKESTIIGTNVMFNVFWILLVYSNNLTLSIFLSERAILLFTEFVVLSSDPKVNKDLSYVPNIIDAMNFSYKKTIGPLLISNISKFKKKKITIKNCAFLVKYILNIIYLNFEIKNVNNFLTLILNNIIDNIYALIKIIEDDVLFMIILKKINYILVEKKNIESMYNFLNFLINLKKNNDNIKYMILNYKL